MFRSDSRDVRYLNKIRQAIGRETTRLPWFYEITFRCNAARNYNRNRAIRRFIGGFHAHDEAVLRSRSAADTKVLQTSWDVAGSVTARIKQDGDGAGNYPRYPTGVDAADTKISVVQGKR
jgi:hypothetical protein